MNRDNRPLFTSSLFPQTPYIFLTGKGGVGKTSTACAMAIELADAGRKIMLVSTDPASNLQDVFQMKLDNKGTSIPSVPNLTVANFDPETAAREYRESVLEPYRGKLPEAILTNMEEQLSGSCTVEIAAFNEFSGFITDHEAVKTYDHIIFDTAPTGHTLRMLELPSAWTDFISSNTHGASCLGQLSGLEEKKDTYKRAVDNLANAAQTTVILVTRPENTPILEAKRASEELKEIGVTNQVLVLNGILEERGDAVSSALYNKQQEAISLMDNDFENMAQYSVPLRPYNVTNVNSARAMLRTHTCEPELEISAFTRKTESLKSVVDSLHKEKKKVILTMGKGGVGKTTIAASVALGLAEKGEKVHLTTTDPAAHLSHVLTSEFGSNLTMSFIDEKEELERYREEVLTLAGESLSENDRAYIEEDLRSPCTQEIAVFRAFAKVVERAENEIVVIDTAPTGHTLLLLDSAQNYHKEIERSQGNVPDSVKRLLPRLRDSSETEIMIITLPEATPIYEAERLNIDLERAGLSSKWWIVNSSLHATGTTHPVLRAKAENEAQWLERVYDVSKGNMALIDWKTETIQGDNLRQLLK